MPDSRLVPRPEARSESIVVRPVLWQARQDLTEFSKAQAIPALVMGIGTFITALVLGQITSWGSALVLVFGSVAVGVILYALLAILRAPFIVIAQHHRQLFDVNQRLVEMEARSVDVSLSAPVALQAPEAVAPTQIPASSIEYTNHVVVDRWACADSYGFTRYEPNDKREAELLKYEILLARFYYKPQRDVPPYVYIKAQIAIADAEGVPIQARYDAIWDENSENSYKHFSTADTHALALVVLPKQAGDGPTIYEHTITEGSFAPAFTMLKGKEFVLQLELIGKVNNITVLNVPMRFMLSLEPQPTLTFLG